MRNWMNSSVMNHTTLNLGVTISVKRINLSTTTLDKAEVILFVLSFGGIILSPKHYKKII
jgi:hypothetical protein